MAAVQGRKRGIPRGGDDWGQESAGHHCSTGADRGLHVHSAHRATSSTFLATTGGATSGATSAPPAAIGEIKVDFQYGIQVRVCQESGWGSSKWSVG